MANYKEIVTKAVLSKGKRLFTSNHKIEVDNPSTILGCWVINHNFSGVKDNNSITINGSYDVNIWYSYDNDTKTNVIKETNKYSEVVHMREHEEGINEEVIVRSLKQPSCVKAYIEGNTVNYTIEKELGVELVGDVKVKVDVSNDEDPWDDIVEENTDTDKIKDKIDDNFIKEEPVI